MRHYKLVLVLSLTFFLSVGLITQTNVSTEFSPSQIDDPSIERNMTPAADYMFIDSNDDFTPAGFTGSGTEGDPYVLDGQIIDLGNDMGIRIRDTTAHFVIRNCEITGWNSDRAFELVNAHNGTIENNSVHGKFTYGLITSNSKDLNFTGNEIQGVSRGIWGLNLSRADITNNKFLDSIWFGIDIDSASRNITIENNWFHRVNEVSYSGTHGAIYTSADNVSIISNDMMEYIFQLQIKLISHSTTSPVSNMMEYTLLQGLLLLRFIIIPYTMVDHMGFTMWMQITVYTMGT